MKKILVIRFSSIGDIVLTTPIIRCLKEQIENIEIHVLTKNKYKNIYLNNPYIDKVYDFKNQITEVIGDLKKEHYNHIVDLHKNLRSNRVRMSLNIPSSTFPKLNVKKFILVNLGINKLPDIHIVDRYFEAVKPFGIVNDNKGLDFFISETDELQNSDLPAEFREGFFAFVIGGQHFTKILPSKKMIEVCEKVNYPIILLGGPEDAVRGDEIVEAVGENIWNSCGKLNLSQSASIIKMAKGVLTNDTGLMHISAAFHKPIVSVWGNTVPEFGMYPYLPNEKHKFVVIEKKLSCRPCSKIGYKKCPKGHFNCMMKLNSEEIAEKLQEVSQS